MAVSAVSVAAPPNGVLVRSLPPGSSVPITVGVVPDSAPQAAMSITRIKAKNRDKRENFLITLLLNN
jgi:hypothetical protein